MPWFANTLFVITADHTSSNVLFDESRTAAGFFSIPIIFYKPDNSLAGMDTTIAQQIDIMPSVLGHLNYTQSYVAFGRDVFDTDGEPCAFNYKDNAYQLFQGDYLLIFDGSRSLGLYNFKTDKLITENLIDRKKDVVRELEIKAKAFIQQYNNRLIENKMTMP